MSEIIPAMLRSAIRARARGRCEYCLLHEEDSWWPHEPDHVIATKHRGPTTLENLSWTCFPCNRHKGTDLASIDELNERIVRLFNPRRDHWTRHFRLDSPRIVARTAIGRVTVFLLQLNRTDRVKVRSLLLRQRLYPRD